MSMEIIVVLSVLGIGVVSGLLWHSHNKEKERAKNALLVANLNERAHRIQRLLDSVPPAYIEKEVKLLLLQQISTIMDKLIELAPKNANFRKSRDSLTTQINETQSSTATPPSPQLKNEQAIKETKLRLQELSKAIELLASNKLIQAATAKKYLANIHSKFIDANINLSIQIADQSRRDNKTKLAIHQYQKAIQGLSQNNKNNRHTEKISQLKGIVDSLSGNKGAPEEPQGGMLTQGVNELADEDESWKKKYF